jgi:hypothetical protein
MKYTGGWKSIRFGVSPEDFKRWTALKEAKGKELHWWEFFAELLNEISEPAKSTPRVWDPEAEFRANRENEPEDPLE